MTTSDLGEHMKAVALALLGEPNRYQSKGTVIRFGTNGSMSVNLKKGTFYSHEEMQGGGVLDLIKREKGHHTPNVWRVV
jgi:putative DNA primase/helicase